MSQFIEQFMERAEKFSEQRFYLLQAAKEVLAVPELAEIACVGSRSQAEHALGLLAKAVERVEQSK